MSYAFHVFMNDEDSPTLTDIAGRLSESMPDGVSVEATETTVTLEEGDWMLRGILNDGDWVAEEATSMAESFADDLSDTQASTLDGATARLEFNPQPEAATDDHYNTWLLASESIAGMPGLLVFSPFDGTFM